MHTTDYQSSQLGIATISGNGLAMAKAIDALALKPVGVMPIPDAGLGIPKHLVALVRTAYVALGLSQPVYLVVLWDKSGQCREGHAIRLAEGNHHILSLHIPISDAVRDSWWLPEIIYHECAHLHAYEAGVCSTEEYAESLGDYSRLELRPVR